MKRTNRKKSRTGRPTLPELDQTKRSVLNSLTSLQSRRSYQHAMDEFIEWYCSEPRLALNRGIVLRYRLQLEARKLAASTINVRLAAVRRLAYEAADTGLLSPELVAGIRRVKGVPQLGRRVGNWLSAAEGEQLLSGFSAQTLRDKRNLAIISLLLGCGLRRSEVVALRVGDIQRREDHWAIIDLVGKAGHVRTVPVPAWVKAAIDAWTQSAPVVSGRLFRAIRKNGAVCGNAEFVAPSPAVPSIFSGSARCAIRHSLAQVQRLCRNVNSASSGLKRRCGAAIGAVLLRARSFIAKSASR